MYFRAVALPDDIIDKVEDEAPSTPTLLEAKYSVFPDLEASFEKFYKVRDLREVLQGNDSTAHWQSIKLWVTCSIPVRIIHLLATSPHDVMYLIFKMTINLRLQARVPFGSLTFSPFLFTVFPNTVNGLFLCEYYLDIGKN